MWSLVVQAGGESRRMGTDKGLLPFLGQPLIQRMIDRLNSLADEVLITSNHPENYNFLGIPVYTDILPGCGALGGLYTALHSSSHTYVAVVACDMPFASRELFEYQLKQLINGASDGILPFSRQGLEPLHAVYRRETCLPAIRSTLEQGERKLISWFPQVNIQTLCVEQTAMFDPLNRVFLNVNTPLELQQAEDLARQLGE